MYKKYIKRIFDFTGALLAIILFSWVIVITAILVALKLGRPVIFKQERPGYKGKIFTVYKFRTMTDEKDKDGNLLSDEIRLTKFGKILRSLSLDELPQFFNVLNGDMSFIGPRPLLVEYLKLYNKKQKKRHDVRPGITGLAQVSGRNAISWEQKFDIDVEYSKNISFMLDFKIFFLTIKKVLIKDGISAEGSVTIERFEGNVK